MHCRAHPEPRGERRRGILPCLSTSSSHRKRSRTAFGYRMKLTCRDQERSLLEVLVRGRRHAQGTPSSSPPVTLRTNSFVSSTKLDALARHLRSLREKDPAFRAIVFSQFTGFLDLVQTLLQREGYVQYRLDGQVPQKQRTQVLQDFAEPSNAPKIFAISLKAISLSTSSLSLLSTDISPTSFRQGAWA